MKNAPGGLYNIVNLWYNILDTVISSKWCVSDPRRQAMPTGEGWFIDARTGEVLPVAEHKSAVRSNPQRFRIRVDEMAGRDRRELLALVFRRGFIRVRWDKRGVVFEFHGGREVALRLIHRFLVEQGAGPYTPVRIHDLAEDGFRLRGFWRELQESWPR